MLREKYSREPAIEDQFRTRLNHGIDSAVADMLVMMLKEDGPTFLHSLYVSYYAESLALFAGYSEEEAHHISREALVHDVGKTVPIVRSLLRRRHLREDEWQEVQRHTLYGGAILRELGLPQYAEVAEQHHENYDGTGYPFGNCGDPNQFGRAPIHPHAELLRIADSYYSAQLSYDKLHVLNAVELKTMGLNGNITSQQFAATQILAGAGTRFHPGLIRPFEQFFNNLRTQPDLFHIPVMDIVMVDDQAMETFSLPSVFLQPPVSGTIIKNHVRPSLH